MKRAAEATTVNGHGFHCAQRGYGLRIVRKVAGICDGVMLQTGRDGWHCFSRRNDEWPYAIHLLGHLYADDIHTTIPLVIKENQPEVVAMRKIGQKLRTWDYTGVHEAIHGFDWSPEAKQFVTAFSELHTKK